MGRLGIHGNDAFGVIHLEPVGTGGRHVVGRDGLFNGFPPAYQDDLEMGVLRQRRECSGHRNVKALVAAMGVQGQDRFLH